jgi:hypothetical protein
MLGVGHSTRATAQFARWLPAVLALLLGTAGADPAIDTGNAAPATPSATINLSAAAGTNSIASPESTSPPPRLIRAALLGPATGPQSGRLVALPSADELEALGARIGSVSITVDDIFNEADPRENNLVYRLANDLHLRTKDRTVSGQLLFDEGDEYSGRETAETARILRDRRYLSDASVEAVDYDPYSNTVDVNVRVRDVWSLSPGVGLGRSGGTSSKKARIVDENFLGLGEYLELEYRSDVDRSGVGLQFRDDNFLRSWWSVGLQYVDTSDGSTRAARFGRPFYELDSRWMAGVNTLAVDETTPMYDRGVKVNEFQAQRDRYEVEGGWSRGLVGGWTTRWLAGYRYDSAEFAPVIGTSDTGTVMLPADRVLSYPWVGVELVQDRYATTHNQDQIGRTEDVFMGRKLRAEFGWAASAFGADRSAGIFALTGESGRQFGPKNLLFTNVGWRGRLEGGSTADALLDAETRYYHRFNEKNLFTASLRGAHGSALDLDHQLLLGGDNGLRGYPLRYQNGESLLLGTVEQRYFTDWFPFRLFRVGGAVFADAGRTFGQAPLATEPEGWLADVGLGLRLGNVRSGLGNVVHMDLAFPLNAGSDVSSMQVLLEAQKSF